jgi:hypothetical protein
LQLLELLFLASAVFSGVKHWRKEVR